MRWDWVNIETSGITVELLHNFDCGHDDFNSFLICDAKGWQANGEAVTYVFVDLDEELSGFTRIYGFVSINTLGLKSSSSTGNKYLPCAEIRLFATDRRLHQSGDPGRLYSDQLFKIALQNLYQMSTHTIGFKAIYLNANSLGLNLYLRNGFREITDFIPSTEEDKLSVDGCTPLLLIIDETAITNMFCDFL